MPARTTSPRPQPDPPQEEAIRTRLGDVFPLYRALLEAGPFTPQWRYYGEKYGWSLKLFEKKRNLCFIGPKEGCFDVAFIFGDRVRDAALAGDQPEDIMGMLRAGRHYPEGWGVTVSVRGAEELELVKQLLAIKRAN